MRVTMLDRWLLLGCTLCFFVAIAWGDVFGACDDKCRQISWYYEDEGKNGINCYNLKLADCSPCYLGNCDNTNAALAGTCLVDTGNQQFSKSTGCTLICTLAPGGYAEAKGGISDKYANMVYFTCQDNSK